MIDSSQCGVSGRQIHLFQPLRDLCKHRSYITGTDGDNKELTMLSNHHTLCLHFICFEINGSVLPQIASGSLGSCVTEFTPNGKNFSKQEEANRFIYVQRAYLLSHFVGPFPSP